MEDTLERIECEARLDTRDYWNCRGFRCYFECPNVKDNQDPAQRYGTNCCGVAMKLDLLRRQRELLEGGGK